MSDSSNGVSAMVHCALWCESQLGLEILDIARGALDPKDSCTLQASGKYLLYAIVLDGGWVSLKVALLDRGEEPELILTTADGRQGWLQICSLVRLFEREEVKSLVKPIELGGGRVVIGG